MSKIELAIIALILAANLSTGILYATFPAVMNLKRLYEDPYLWSQTPLGMKVVGVVLGVFGLIADPIFNWTRGAWRFREWPWAHKTILFTSRVQWHLDNSPKGTRQYREARRWALIGNKMDAKHFRLTPR